MAIAVSGSGSQAQVVSLADSTVSAANLAQITAQTVYRKPAVTGYESQTGNVVVAESKPTALLSQINVMGVHKIKAANPSLVAWTFTMDGHSYYVLQLGNHETLIYDQTTEQWMTWADGNDDIWKIVSGRNWINSGNKADTYGSNVVVGDYTTGSLYILDPLYPYDDQPAGTSSVRFTRLVHGIVTTPTADRIRCYSVDLYGSMGTSTDEFDVTLFYSDDNGNNYADAGTVQTPANDFNLRMQWRSLGSFSRPGRLFKIIDTGAIQRVDGVEVNIGPQGTNS